MRKLKYQPGALLTVVMLALTVLLVLEPQTVRAQVTPDGTELDAKGGLRAPGQIMVKIKPGINVDNLATPDEAPAELQTLFTRLGVRKVTGLGSGTNILLLHFSGPVEAALKLATADPAVEKADANQVMQIEQASPPVTNDPLYLN